MHILLPAALLQPSMTLLEAMPLAASASRARTKLVHLLKASYASFAEDEYALVSQYAINNDDGTPICDADGTFTLKDPHRASEFHAHHHTLLTSRVEVAGATYENHGREVLDFLTASTQELSGIDAEAYNALYDAITESLKPDKDKQ